MPHSAPELTVRSVHDEYVSHSAPVVDSDKCSIAMSTCPISAPELLTRTSQVFTSYEYMPHSAPVVDGEKCSVDI